MIDEVKNRINDLQASRIAELASIHEAITKLSQDAVVLKDELADATKALDDAKHTKTSDKLRKVNDAISMYTERYRQLEQDPLVTDTEYLEVADQIIQHISSLRATFEEKTAVLIKQIFDQANEYSQAYTEAEKVLQRFTTDIAKRDRLTRLNNGGDLYEAVMELANNLIVIQALYKYRS